MELPRAVPAEIRKINRSRIFRFLYEQGAHSRKDIAQQLQLSIPTVVQNLREMEELGLLQEAGTLASTGGRKAVAVCLNYEAKHAIGLDITQTHVSLVVLNLRGDVLCQKRQRMAFSLTPEYFSEIQALVERAVEELKIDPKRILGVGISVPAIVPETGDRLEYAVILSPEMTAEHFQRVLPYPCHFCNDAKAACRAEQWASQEEEDFIYLCLSNSVGGAIVQHGRMSVGRNRRSAEFGHMTLVPDGRLCYCGKRGCLDAYCNAGLLSRHTDGNLGEFFNRLAAADPQICGEWDAYLDYLAVIINNLRVAFDDTIVLGGYVGCYLEPHMARLRELVAARNTFQSHCDFLKQCYYNRFEASAVGAALLYIEPFLNEI